jgi:ABC-type dipeptide/oligopeptide/nickel transport system permease subunit
VNLSKLKRWFVGTPIATAQAHHERLGPVTGLAVFASDNLSSVAYATEEILRVLLLAGVGALAFSVPIGLCIGAVIGFVILSYRQNIENHMVTIVIPEFIPAKWWQQLLHNQTALVIKGALLFRRNVVVTDVPYHLRR